MTLLVDRRKDNYDDLLMLARDARASRSRANRWTTGLVVGAMTAMGVYVAMVSQEVDQLREAAKEAGEQRDTIKAEYAKLMDDRNALKVQMDVFARYKDMYADIAPALILGDRFKDIAVNVSGTPNGGGGGDSGGTTATPQFTMSNLVWIVDGSRRFPMTSGDVLWVPEGKFWIEMESNRGGKPDTITINEDQEEPRPSSAADGSKYTFKGDGDSFQIKVRDAARRGIANCIRLTYHDESSRFGFEGTEFVDIEVLYHNDPPCTNP